MTIWGKGSQLSTQPTTASESLRQPDFTPEAIGTWAAKQKAGTVLCQAYQHNQCADNPCSMRAPTIVLRANDHICCLRYPACIHSRDIKQAKQDCWRAEQMAWVTAGSASNSGHPTVGQKQQTAAQATAAARHFSSHGGASVDTPARQSSAPQVAPQQGTIDGTENETIQHTGMLDHQSGSEGLVEADTGDECSPLHFVDILDGKNRPMSRAMDWCGWSTSSFEKFPAVCSCVW